MSKKSRFRGCFDKQYGREIVFEKVSLIDMQMLALLINTLATDEKYPVLKKDNLTIPIQM